MKKQALIILALFCFSCERSSETEKEGPTGTGRPRQLITSADGKTFFLGFTDVREFDSQLKHMKSYKIQVRKFEGLQVDQSLTLSSWWQPGLYSVHC
ncbi:DUF4221 family protein [Algoriphagus resistens]|uniref:DUF4221 family protein n=1 Tax=Algoriphagus resistens TaxID=1750590 RepID=UPI0007168B6C|nr:DUF4221 family protein [Algoriphagus resistens]